MIFHPDILNRAHPLNRGRVGWWMVRPPTDGGKFLPDLMGLHTATLTNMGTTGGWRSTTRPGGFGHVLFDGSNDYIDCTAAAALNTPAMSMAVWVNASAFAAYTGAIGKSNGAGTYFEILIKSTGKLAMYLNASGDVSYDGTGTYTLATGNWYRLMMTYAAGTGLAGYVNGLLDKAVAGASAISGAALTISIGTDLGTAGRYFTGAIDDASVWNRALTAAEVRADYELSARGYPGVLNSIMPLDYGATAGALIRRIVAGRAA